MPSAFVVEGRLFVFYRLLCSRFLQSNLTRYQATSCTVSVAGVQITCATAPGVGANLYWSLTLATQSTSTPIGPSAYGRPVISTFAGAGSTGGLTTGAQVPYVWAMRVCTDLCAVCCLPIGLAVGVVAHVRSCTQPPSEVRVPFFNWDWPLLFLLTRR